MTHYSQILFFLRIPLLKRVCDISYPLKLCRKMGLFLVWRLGGFFLVFQLRLLEFWVSLLVIYFCPAKSVGGTLIQLSFTLRILESLCKNKPPNIMIIAEAKKRWVQNSYGGFYTFYKMNKYDLEYFRCVCHDILSRIYLTLLPPSWDFTGLIFIVQNYCTW